MSSDIHFFIVHDDNSKKELMLPENFVRKHWEGSSNPIVLKLPNNVKFKVHWIKHEGNIRLSDGWGRFTEISHLKHGYLLLFKYKRSLYFKVRIYSYVGLEARVAPKEYVSFFKVLMQSNFEEELMLPKSFTKDHWKGMSNPIIFKLPTNVQCKVHWTERDNRICLKEGWKEFTQMYCLSFAYFLFFKYIGGSCFEVVICDQSKLEIDYSSSLRRDEETAKNPEVIEISDDDYDEIVDESERDAELLKRKKTNTGAARIPVKKSLEDDQCCKALEKAKAFHSKLQNPSFVREMWPSYVKQNLLRVPNCFSKIHLRELQLQRTEATIGVHGDMTWPVIFCNSTDNRVIIIGGWKPFCQKYELEADDVCVFEMIEIKPLKFKIEIFRVREEPSCDQHLQADQQNHDYPERGGAQDMEERGNGRLGKRKRNDGISRSFPETDELERDDRSRRGKVRISPETTPKDKPIKYSQCSKALERAKAFQSQLKNPSFVREITASYLGRDSLRFPTPFSRDNLQGSEGIATIRVSSDTAWPVKWRFENSSGVDRAVINGGWKPFCEKYGLRVGDVCVFERIEVTPLSFRIKIVRARDEPSYDDQHLQESGSSNMEANQFKIQIKKSHLMSTIVFIPAEFRKRHKEFLGEEVNLQVGEMSWPVKVLPRGAFSKGWPAFVRGCKLHVGDVCLFKITDEENLVFKVSIQQH